MLSIIQGEPKMFDKQEIKNDEIEIFTNSGADPILAGIMSDLFGPIRYSPSTKNLVVRIDEARLYINFQYLAFDMLLTKQTDEARRYMERAVKLSPKKTSFERQKILNNLDKVQLIVTASIPYFDKLRSEKYQMETLGHYLI